MVHLTSLRYLRVSGCFAIRMLPESLGEVQSLQKMTIKNCKSLSIFPQSMAHLTSLRSLEVSGCSTICMLPESLRELWSLQELTIQSCRATPTSILEVVVDAYRQMLHISCCTFHELPDWLGELRCLRRLSIKGFRELVCLPESMCGLTSLEELWISDCPGIKSLPEWIKGLTSLWNLEILSCPVLKRRCERGKGEDWHLISHAGFTKPTGPVKLSTSGSGLPDRFDRKPVETGWIQIQIQI
ncbi:hypothetical protein PVAP13_3NG057790 [Panicum virgatum]|uniref:Disease resistance R13L4/SHOC-2-like LRR domain-containing protein n=1 Tax=Panicum virgatum TaxID=38727 RepID=A0A8T0TTZ5_PANVG|nr:hypothetical protein PVAP13_3NG057790 [Panicum virgatum]